MAQNLPYPTMHLPALPAPRRIYWEDISTFSSLLLLTYLLLDRDTAGYA